MVTTIDKNVLRSREILLAESLDIEALLTLPHLTRQYRKEREQVRESLRELQSGGKVDDAPGRLAVAYVCLGEMERARETATKATSSALAALVLGMIDEARSDYAAALKHYQKSAELAPSSPPCVLRQLSAFRRSGRAEDALELIEKLRREFSDKADLHCHEGRCRQELGQYQEALECFRKALEVNPNHAETRFYAAYLSDLRGLDQEAIEHYRHVGPGCADTYINACLNLALLYEDHEEYQLAIDCCRKVLRVDPNNRRAKLFLKAAEASATMYYSPEETKQSEKLEAVLRVPVSDFELSVRSRNCLAKMNIQTLGDLVKKTESEMLSYKNFGETSLREIKEMLTSRGLRLGLMREDAATRAAHERAKSGPSPELLAKSIGEIELGVRARKCMEMMGIRTVGDLVSRSELDLCQAKNFGRVSLNEIKKRMAELGLSLKDAK